MAHLLIVGLGYGGCAVSRLARDAGWRVTGTSRRDVVLPGIETIDPAALPTALRTATHLLTTAAPDEAGDPILRAAAPAIADAPHLRWIGVLSSTAVYGDRGGAWVDEEAAPHATSARGQRRLAAEAGWRAIAGHRSLDLIRLAGIYGPGRSAFDDLRAGRARRVDKPGHKFSRIHRDDVAALVLAAAGQERGPGTRVLHGADREPAEAAAVIAEAAQLLGQPPPPLVPFAQAWVGMSPMARSFWSDDRQICSRATLAALGLSWHHPTYREGLRAILVREQAGPAEDAEQVGRS